MPHASERKRAKAILALLLSFAAGYVDIVGFLAFFRVFTAHVTGDTVHMANELVTARLGDAATAALVIAAFVAGSVAGRAIIETGKRRQARSIAWVVFALEGALIAVVPLIAPRLHPLAKTQIANWDLLILLATAMGLQTASLTRIGPLTVHTTFVTGMLNKLAQLLSKILFSTYDLLRAPSPEARAEHANWRRAVSRRARFIFSIWIFYAAGAVGGAALERQWSLRALYIPVAILAGACVADQVWPLSIEEEKEQSEE